MVIWTNVCSIALARRHVFTPRPTAVISDGFLLRCTRAFSISTDRLTADPCSERGHLPRIRGTKSEAGKACDISATRGPRPIYRNSPSLERTIRLTVAELVLTAKRSALIASLSALYPRFETFNAEGCTVPRLWARFSCPKECRLRFMRRWHSLRSVHLRKPQQRSVSSPCC